MALDKPSFGDQLYFFIGLAHTTAKFKNVYCEIFFGPKLVNAVKTSRILEEMLGRYLREALACDGRIHLAMCMTQEVW